MSDAYAMDADLLASGLPDAAAVQHLAGLLQDGRDVEGRGSVANALVALAGREPHPVAKAALLERSAALVRDGDPERAALLLREAIRLHPTASRCADLAGLADAEPSLSRFGRLADLIDSAAVLGDDGPYVGWLLAARRHIERGLGARALAALDHAALHIDESSADATEAEELRATAAEQARDREDVLAAARDEITAAADPEASAEALVCYAEVLVLGDTPPADVAAVLADAADAGAEPGRVAPLWAEAARAAGQVRPLARALAALLSTAQPPHLRVRIADELANLPGVDDTEPMALIVALDALTEALPDDLALRARLLGARALAGEDDAEPALELLRGEAVRTRDRQAEAAAAMALGRLAVRRGDGERAERLLRRVRTLEPDNAVALAYFEARYREAADHERLFLLLQSRLATAAPELAIALAAEMAELAEGPLQSPERAAEAWHRVLTLAPDHEQALAALARLERDSGDAVVLLDLLQRRAQVLGAKGDAAAEVAVRAEIASLCERGGELPDAALYRATLARLVELHPYASEALVQALAGLSEGSLAYAAALPTAAAATSAALWQALLGRRPDDATTRARAAQALRQAGDRDAAVATAAVALGFGAAAVAGVAPTAEQLASRAAEPAIADLLELWVELTVPDAPAREAATAALALARPSAPVIAEQQLAGAVAAGDVAATLAAGRQLGMDADALDAWVAARAAEASPQRQPQVWLLAARLAADAGAGDRAAALAAAAADGAAAVASLDPSASDGAVLTSAWELAQASDDLACRRQVLAAWVRATATADQASLWWATAIVASDSGDGPAAWAARVACLQALAEEGVSGADAAAPYGPAPGIAEVAALVLATAEEGDGVGAAVAVVAAAAEHRLAQGASAQARDLLGPAVERALVAGEGLAAAHAVWQRWLGLGDATHDEWVAAEQLAEAVGDWPAALRAVLAQAALADAEQAIDHTLRAAALAAGAAADHDQASRLWRQVLQRRPGCVEAWTGLVDGARARGDQQELAQLLEEMTAAPLASVALACDACLQRLELLGGEDPARLLALAAAPLARLAEVDGLPAEGESLLTVVAAWLDVAEHAAAAAALVLPVARRHGRHEELAAALAVATPPADPEGRVARALDLATVRDGALGDGLGALAALADALALDPHRMELWDRAEALADRYALQDRCDDVYARIAGVDANAVAFLRTPRPAAETSGDEAVLHADLLERWAKRAEARGLDERAAAAWRALADLRPGTLGPLDALERLWRAARDGEALCQVLEERCAVSAGDDATAAWQRLAAVWRDDRRDPIRAAEVWARATAAQPHADALWQGRCAHLRALGDDSGLVAALREHLAAIEASGDVAAQAETRLALQRQLAEALAAEQPAAALSLWTALLTTDPTDDGAADAALGLLAYGDAATLSQLATVFAARGQPEAEDLALEQRASLGLDPRERVLDLSRQADLRAHALGRPLAALAALADALTLAPAEESLAARLEALASTPGDEVDPATVAAALAQAADAATDAATRVALLRRAERILAAHGGDDAAAEIAGRLAQEGGDAAAFDHWIEALQGQGRHRDAARAIAEKLAASPGAADEATRGGLLAQARRVAEGAAAGGDIELALEALAPCLSHGPGDDDAWELAAAWQEALGPGHREALRSLRERALAAAASPDVRQQRLIALVDMHIEDGTRETAFALCAGAVEAAAAEHRDALVELAVSVGEGAGLHGDAAALLASTAAAAGPAQAAQRWLRAARLSVSDEPAQARLWAESALLQADPSDDRGRETAADAAALLVALQPHGALDTSLGLRVAEALLPRDRDAAADLLERLALAAAGESADALWSRLAAVAADPSPALEALALAHPEEDARWTALATALGHDRADELTTALLRAVDAAEGAPLRAELLRRAAVTAIDRGDAETGVAWLLAAAELTPSDTDGWRQVLAAAAPAGLFQPQAEALLHLASAADPAEAGGWLRQALEAAAASGDGELHLRALDAAIAAGQGGDQDRRQALALALDAGGPGADQRLDAAIAAASGRDAALLLCRRGQRQLQRDAVAAAAASWLDACAAAGDADLAAEGEAAALAAALVERAHTLPEQTRAPVMRAAVRALSPEREPMRWASALLQAMAPDDSPARQRDDLDALVLHAEGPLADPSLAAEWSARALLLAPDERARLDALWLRVVATDGKAWGAVAPAVAAALEVPVTEEERQDAARACQWLCRYGAESALVAAIERRASGPAFALGAMLQLTGCLRRAGLIDLANTLEANARAHAAPDDGAVIAVGLVQAAVDDPSRLDDALGAWLAALAQPGVADAAPTLGAAAQRAERLDAWLDAAEAALGRDDVSRDGRHAIAAACAEAAAALDDPGRAADAWALVWEADAADADAAEQALAWRRAAGGGARLFADLERALGAGVGDHAELRKELAAGYLAAERDRDALAHARALLDADPADGDARDIVAALAERLAAGRDAVDTLVAHARAAGDAEALASWLARRVEQRGDAACADDLDALATAALGRADLDGARQWVDRLLAVRPDAATLQLAVAIAQASGDAAMVAALSQRLAGVAMNDDERTTLFRSLRRAAATSDELRRPARGATSAEETVLRAEIAAVPSDRGAWERLDAMLEAQQRWPELIETRRARLDHLGDDDERIALLHEVAGLAAAIGRLDDAVAAWRSIAALAPADAAPWQAMAEALDGVAGRHVERAAALEAWGLRGGDEAALTALCEAARLYVGKLGDREAAARVYGEVFARAPQTDEAFVFLERAAADEPRRLIPLLAARAAAMAEGPGRVVVWRKLAALQSQAGLHQDRRVTLKRALAEAPSNDALAVELLEAAEDANDWPTFRDTAALRLERQLPRPERMLLLRKLARQAVDHDDAAARWLDELAKLAPHDAELTSLRAAAAALSSDPETAATGLEAQLRSVEDGPRKVRLLDRLGALYADRLGQPTKAIVAWERLVRLQPDRFDIHGRLVDAFHARGSKEALAAALRHWLDACPPAAAERPELTLRLGALLLELGRDDEADTLLAEAVAREPEDVQALSALALLRTRQGRLAEAAELQVRAIARLERRGPSQELTAASRRAGELLERLGRHGEARDRYRTALVGHAEDVVALLGHGRTSLAVDDVPRAIADFERVSRLAAKQATERQRAEAALRLGECWLRLGKRSQARASFNLALELQPGMEDALKGLNQT